MALYHGSRLDSVLKILKGGVLALYHCSRLGRVFKILMGGLSGSVLMISDGGVFSFLRFFYAETTNGDEGE